MTVTWSEVLDSLAAQLELQERCLGLGYRAPEDLEIDPPDTAMGEVERVRAADLFERCEHLLDVATERAVATRSNARSPYGSGAL